MPYLTLGDARIHYIDEGQGPAIILLHGLACGSAMWGRQILSFRGRYRVLAPDLRGHGLTQCLVKLEEFDAARYVDDLVGLIDALDLDRVHVVGFSMGGGVALGMAARVPEKLSSLVLIGVGSGSDDPDGARKRARHWADILAGQGRGAWVDALIRSPFFRHCAETGPAAERRLREYLGAHPDGPMELILRHVLAMRGPIYDNRDDIARVQIPTLVIAGALDDECRKTSQFLADTISGADLVLIDKVGHAVPLEDPARFDAEVLNFLENVSSGPDP